MTNQLGRLDLKNDLMEMMIEAPTTSVGMVNGKTFPLIFTPLHNKLVGFIELQEFFIRSHDKLKEQLSEHGAILFKGFDIRTPEEWASVLNKTGLMDPQPEVPKGATGIMSVQNAILEKIKMLENEPVSFHQNLPQTPSHLFFYCSIN
jgi:hypothetical protein